MLKIGQKVKHKIALFEGTIVARCKFMGGRVTVLIMPVSVRNVPPHSVWCEITEVEPVTEEGQ